MSRVVKDKGNAKQNNAVTAGPIERHALHSSAFAFASFPEGTSARGTVAASVATVSVLGRYQVKDANFCDGSGFSAYRRSSTRSLKDGDAERDERGREGFSEKKERECDRLTSQWKRKWESHPCNFAYINLYITI